MSERKHKLDRRIQLVLNQDKLTTKLIKLGHHIVKNPNDVEAEHHFLLIKDYSKWLGV